MPGQLLHNSRADLQQKVDDFPPAQQPMRYGNTAFRCAVPLSSSNLPPPPTPDVPRHRSWFDYVNASAEEKLRDILPAAATTADNVQQLAAYLCSSFGDRQRIDYGTGHELNFVALLLCLSKLQALPPSDAAAIVLVVFAAYIALCRRLQRTLAQPLVPRPCHHHKQITDRNAVTFSSRQAATACGASTTTSS
jgi:hypothetical protein